METIQLTLNRLGLPKDLGAVWIGGTASSGTGDTFSVRSPVDGSPLATLTAASANDLPRVLSAASDAFLQWRIVPAPLRGEFVRRVGNRFRELK